MTRLALCEPARTIIQRLGGETAVARDLGLSRTTVWLWQVPQPRGRGGAIPRWHHAKLLDLAKTTGVQLSELDFHRMADASADGAGMRLSA
jgi:hypothetical protein